MIIELEQEESLRNRVCIFCQSMLEQTESHYNPNFFGCPNHCMRVWYMYQNQITTDKWAGFRVFLNNATCIRYYTGSDDLEVRVSGGAVTYHLPEPEHFNIFSYSIADLTEKVERMIFLADL